MHTLGVTLGDDFREPNYEDIGLSKAFRDKDWRSFKRLVSAYESRHQKFAWKLPDSYLQLERIHKYFSNPRYIFVYRDVLAIANRKNLAKNIDSFQSIESSLAAYKKILKFIQKIDPPAMHVSYEKLLLNKNNYAVELAKFCKIKASDELLKQVSAVVEPSPEKYLNWSSVNRKLSDWKQLKQLGYDGCIDRASNNTVAGWLLNTATDEPLVVDLLINGEWITQSICNLYRKDLIRADKSCTGTAGFNITLPVTLIKNDQISLRPHGCTEALIKVID